MKSITLTIAITLIFAVESIGQIKPVQNLNWEHWYEMPINYFVLEWDAPEEPHDEIRGYNVYQNDELFMFIEETSIYNLPGPDGPYSNCGGEVFLLIPEGPFRAHVTAVYEPDGIESGYTESVYVEGAMIGIEEVVFEKNILYPNPSNGIIYLQNNDFDSIIIYDMSGKRIRELDSQTEINLSDLAKGIYFLQLTSNTQNETHKIILQ